MDTIMQRYIEQRNILYKYNIKDIDALVENRYKLVNDMQQKEEENKIVEELRKALEDI